MNTWGDLASYMTCEVCGAATLHKSHKLCKKCWGKQQDQARWELCLETGHQAEQMVAIRLTYAGYHLISVNPNCIESTPYSIDHILLAIGKHTVWLEIKSKRLYHRAPGVTQHLHIKAKELEWMVAWQTITGIPIMIVFVCYYTRTLPDNPIFYGISLDKALTVGIQHRKLVVLDTKDIM